MSSAFGSGGPRPAESSLRQHRSNLSVSSAGQNATESESYDEQHAGSSAGGSNFTFSVPHASGQGYAGYPASQGAPLSGSETSRRSSSIYMEDNKDFINRTPTSNQHPLPGTYPKMAASPISHTRGLGIDSIGAGAVGPPRQSPPAATPQLIRATQVSGSTPIPQGGPSSYTQPSMPNESPSPTGRAQLELHGNLAEMAKGWSHSEWRQGRRLVQFWRKQEGTTIHATFRPIDISDYVQRSIVINCIFREDKNECFVTSVDTIYLLESLVASQFTIEEKNRIRRNLEGFRPITISKSKKESEAFFKRIMSFGNPKPRNIEKDVKVFPWKVLAEALKKIIGKYSANPEPMLAPPMPYAPMGYIDDGSAGNGALTSSSSGSFHHARDDSMNSSGSRGSYYYTSGSAQDPGFGTAGDGSFSGPSHPHMPGSSHGGGLVGTDTNSSPFGSFSAHHHAHSFPGTSMAGQHLGSGHLPPPSMGSFGGHYQSQSGGMGSVDSSSVAAGHSSEFLPPFGSHGSVQRQSSDSHGHAAGYTHGHGSGSYNSGTGAVPGSDTGSTGLYMPPSSDSFSTGFGR